MIYFKPQQPTIELPEDFDVAADIRRVERELAEQRTAAHKARILGHMPEQLRTCDVQALLGRVRDPQFRDFAESWQWGMAGIVLSGRSGLGKTSAAGALFLRLLAAQDRRWRGLQWLSAVRFVRARTEARGVDSPEDVDPTVLYERATLLVIDDLGKEPDTQWAKEIIHGLIDARYLRGESTITTTELDGAQLLNRYGTATARRLYESKGRVGKVIEAQRRAA